MGADIERFSAGGYLPVSFLDWDGHVSAVVFTLGCNFRCPWCHNSDLVLERSDPINLDFIVKDIVKRKKFLDGVVLTGGEPCIWDGLFTFLRFMKDMGISVKLDTNGSFPDTLSMILEEGLTAHVAMDVKSPLNSHSLKALTGVDADPDVLKKCMGVIKKSAPSYEFRTTFVAPLLSIEDMRMIREEVSDDSHWVVQCFRPMNCLDTRCLGFNASDVKRLKEEFPDIKLRG